MDFTHVKDSGDRQAFKSGAVRDLQSGKGRFDLLNPMVLMRLAKHYENGAVKYGCRNWEKGIPSSRYYDSAMRHLIRYMEGDRSEDHLSAILWNVSGLIYNEEMIERELMLAEINDLPSYIKPIKKNKETKKCINMKKKT